MLVIWYFSFVFLLLFNSHSCRHQNGFGIEVDAYIRAIEEADRKVEKLLETVSRRAEATQETWLVVLTTDHGGTARKNMCKEVIGEFRALGSPVNDQEYKYQGVHGMGTDQHQLVWMIYSLIQGKMRIEPSSPKLDSTHSEGKKLPFQPGEILPSPRTVDVVPTIVHFFGGSISSDWKLDGQPLPLFQERTVMEPPKRHQAIPH